MTNEDFIREHRQDDIRSLALKRGPEGVDVVWCLQQIEGWQLAQKKLPRWAAAEGTLWFPPKLSMEQCSSESTAVYKRSLAERLLPAEQRQGMIDLTGGFGIDFSYMAQLFDRATYVERQANLCDIARHNLPLLGLAGAEVVQGDCTSMDQISADLIFIDPARRDTAGRKTVAIEDCTPNIVEMQDELLAHSRYLIIKLSPMLDISQALRSLRHVTEVHAVGVRGECKELLLVLRGQKGKEGQNMQDGQQPADDASTLTYHCVNLDTDDEPLLCSETQRRNAASGMEVLPSESALQDMLFEPNACVLKAGCQDMLSVYYGLKKLHPCSNLFVGEEPIPHFPGRQFRVEAVSDFSKKGLKDILAGVKQGNLTVRNFPNSVAELRKKLKLREGGDLYFFATTRADGAHVLLRCRK